MRSVATNKAADCSQQCPFNPYSPEASVPSCRWAEQYDLPKVQSQENWSQDPNQSFLTPELGLSEFNKYLLSAYYVLDIVPGTWDISENKPRALPSWSLQSSIHDHCAYMLSVTMSKSQKLSAPLFSAASWGEEAGLAQTWVTCLVHIDAK